MESRTSHQNFLKDSEIEVININPPAIKTKSNRKFSEKIAKVYFKRKGYYVFRGDYLDFYGKENNWKYEKFDEVKEYYKNTDKILCELLTIKKFYKLVDYCKEHKGTPDFFMWNPLINKYLFVEVKLNNEKLMNNQKKTILFIKNKIGVEVLLFRVVSGKVPIYGSLDLAEGNSNSVNNELYNKLKEWRFQKCQKLRLLPYMILTNKTLEEISSKKPNTKNDLLKIKGLGYQKLKNYGEEILKIVSD